MSRRSLAALALSGLLALSGGLLAESAAGASMPGHGAASVTAKNPKNKNKKKVVAIKLAKTPLGKILVNAKGFTLYVFDPDGTDTSSSKCVGACANVWPAFIAKKPKVGKGLDQSLVVVGGAKQVAYNNHLLYLFVNDTAAGQTNGQGVGNIWHVVGADGNPIT